MNHLVNMLMLLNALTWNEISKIKEAFDKHKRIIILGMVVATLLHHTLRII